MKSRCFEQFLNPSIATIFTTKGLVLPSHSPWPLPLKIMTSFIDESVFYVNTLSPIVTLLCGEGFE